mgnify:CR=1 FL=1
MIQKDEKLIPCFNTFYEYLRDVYRVELQSRDIKVSKDDFNIDNLLTTLTPYYRGGRYDFLLNSQQNIDLLSKRFIVFEIDAIKDNKDLFPVVTIIIMESFINKMRRLKGIRKMILIEEAWKAIASANMAYYIKYLYKTVRSSLVKLSLSLRKWTTLFRVLSSRKVSSTTPTARFCLTSEST